MRFRRDPRTETYQQANVRPSAQEFLRPTTFSVLVRFDCHKAVRELKQSGGKCGMEKLQVTGDTGRFASRENRTRQNGKALHVSLTFARQELQVRRTFCA